MLALHMVRKPDDGLNPASFEDPGWSPWEQEFKNERKAINGLLSKSMTCLAFWIRAVNHPAGFGKGS